MNLLRRPGNLHKCRQSEVELAPNKTCREKAPGHVPDSEKVYYQKKERVAKALAALSLSWAPHAGVAMGLHPQCPDAKEVAAIKAQEWASVEARTLWQAKAAWENWAACAEARSYKNIRAAPASLITLWMNSPGTSSGARSLQGPSLARLARRCTSTPHQSNETHGTETGRSGRANYDSAAGPRDCGKRRS